MRGVSAIRKEIEKELARAKDDRAKAKTPTAQNYFDGIVAAYEHTLALLHQ